MEHAVSDLLVDRIDSFLGSPDFDPHGDPIPKADGTVRKANGSLLNVMRIGDSVRVVRVLDQSSEFLKRLTEEGIEIGATIEVLAQKMIYFSCLSMQGLVAIFRRIWPAAYW